MSGPLLVTDAPHLLYRAFFGLPDSITGAGGRPVNALLGSVNQTLWCVQRWHPRAVVMCFGAESADYRTEAYPPYHAHRPEMPGDLAHQWTQAPDLYRALGWHVVDSDAFEADDVMGTLCELEAEAGGTALILSGDRDMFQCATQDVHVLLQQRGREGPEELGPDGVRVNLVAAGPLRTMAAKSIPGFEAFETTWEQRAPLGWDITDTEPAARACVALLSDWFPATTGEIVHVDGGVHAVGA